MLDNEGAYLTIKQFKEILESAHVPPPDMCEDCSYENIQAVLISEDDAVMEFENIIRLFSI
jgi:hypothetical protein